MPQRRSRETSSSRETFGAGDPGVCHQIDADAEGRHAARRRHRDCRRHDDAVLVRREVSREQKRAEQADRSRADARRAASRLRSGQRVAAGLRSSLTRRHASAFPRAADASEQPALRRPERQHALARCRDLADVRPVAGNDASRVGHQVDDAREPPFDLTRSSPCSGTLACGVPSAEKRPMR